MSFFRDYNGKIDKENIGFAAFMAIPVSALLAMAVCGLSWAVPHLLTGPCAMRGGYDRFEADYVVCANGERRAYDPKTKTFYDVKVMLTNGQ